MTELISCNTTIPTKKSQSFSTAAMAWLLSKWWSSSLEIPLSLIDDASPRWSYNYRCIHSGWCPRRKCDRHSSPWCHSLITRWQHFTLLVCPFRAVSSQEMLQTFFSLMSLPYHLLTTLPSVRPFRVVSSQEMLQKFFSLMPLPLSLGVQHQFHSLVSLGWCICRYWNAWRHYDWAYLMQHYHPDHKIMGLFDSCGWPACYCSKDLPVRAWTCTRQQASWKLQFGWHPACARVFLRSRSPLILMLVRVHCKARERSTAEEKSGRGPTLVSQFTAVIFELQLSMWFNSYIYVVLKCEQNGNKWAHCWRQRARLCEMTWCIFGGRGINFDLFDL